MTQIHELKTDPDVFLDVIAGNKKFEIRLNDRAFKVGDELHLRRTKHSGEEMKAGSPLEYNGGKFVVYVTHLIEGPRYGLNEGWVIMSIEPRDLAA